MFIGSHIFTFETNDKIIKFISNVGNNESPISHAYGETNLYFFNHNRIYRPYNTIQSDNIRNKILEMDETYLPFELLNTTVIADKSKLNGYHLIATRWTDEKYSRIS